MKNKIDKLAMAEGVISTEKISSKALILNNQYELKDLKHQQVKKQLNVYTSSDGILQCDGRLNNANINECTKQPILLNCDYYAELIVLKYHELTRHGKTNAVLTSLRQKFWIPKGRSFVENIISPAYVYPVPPDLPEFRVSDEPPFTNVRVDYCRPLFVKPSLNGDRNAIFKCWILLFTCCTTRGVSRYSHKCWSERFYLCTM